MLTISPQSGPTSALALSTLLLSGCVSQSAYDQVRSQNQQLQSQNQQLQQQVSAQQDHIARLQGAIAYTVNSDLLFRPGSWQMTTRGEELIAGYAKRLVANQQNKLVVNGYTDNAPIGPALQRQGITTNQELSQKRAEAVMQYLISQGVSPDMIAAKGYGDANPVASNDTAQGRARNRRVEITVAS
ncbi:OmpA family protein [Azospirillum canadense]|uniref:OmpA family protein n=1 Tax=Azospirillum canadense TaxID=403962 RepID=UPI0022270A2D|nr:OmpA family protein [Azospirillum canadense]MCW2243126.1 chemotaxis protein MotB [Azospirillum canadense]